MVKVCETDCEAVSVAVMVIVAVPAVLPGVTVTVAPETEAVATEVFDDWTPYVSVSVSEKYDEAV